MLLILFPFASYDSARFWGASVDEQMIPCTLPGSTNAHVEAGYGQRVIGIRLNSLRKHVSARLYDKITAQAKLRVMPCSGISRTRAANWIESRLDRLMSRPDLVNSQAHSNAMLNEIVELLVELSKNFLASPNQVPVRTTRSGFLKALDFIREQPNENISISELRVASGISERSLQYSFRTELGMTPKQFLLRHRLHAARRALLLCNESDARVSDVATSLGFFELGRFAGRYKRLFGELPSETLKYRT